MKTDYIPRSDADFDKWASNLVTYVKSKTVDFKEPEWPDIPYEHVNELVEAYDEWKAAYERTLVPHTPGATAAKNEKRDKLKKLIREFVKRYIHFSPVTKEQRADMNIPEHDNIRSPIPAPSGTAKGSVELTVKGQLTVAWELEGYHADSRPDHGVRIHYGVVAANSADQSAKTGKHYYLAAPPDGPDLLKEDVFTRKKKYTIDFPYEDSSLEAFLCLRLENEKGEAGPWGTMFSAVIP